MGGADLLGILERSGLLVDPLLVPKRLLHTAGEVVHHRVPDGAGELEEVGVEGTKGLERVQVHRM